MKLKPSIVAILAGAACVTAFPQQTLTPAEKRARAAWQKEIDATQPEGLGCFTIEYPSTQWRQVACVDAPPTFVGKPPRAAVDQVAVRPLSHGSTGALRDKMDLVVARNQGEWVAAWSLPYTDQHGVRNGVPAQSPVVDFGHDMVVGVVGPAAPNSCTSVEITSVVHRENQLEVGYRLHKPSAGEACLDAFFSPYDFVAVPLSTSTVSFTELSAN